MLAFRAEERKTGIRMVMLSTLLPMTFKVVINIKSRKKKDLLTNSKIFRIPAGVLKTIVLQLMLHRPIFEFVVPVLVVVVLQKSAKRI